MATFSYSFSIQNSTTLKAQGWSPDVKLRGVVVLVHGLGEHFGRYRHVVQAFNQAGLAVLAFDLPGHGQSDGKRGCTPIYEELMNCIAYQLAEASRRFPGVPCFLYGHSLGGGLVLNYAIRRKPQIAGVISTSPALRTTTPVPGPKQILARVMSRLQPDFVMNNGLDTAGLSRDPKIAKAYKSDPLVHPLVSARLGWDLIQSGAWALQHAIDFPNLPLLIMHGTADPICDFTASAEFAKAVKGDVTHKAWEGFFHETHNEPEKGQVIQYMVEWIVKHC